MFQDKLNPQAKAEEKVQEPKKPEKRKVYDYEFGKASNQRAVKKKTDVVNKNIMNFLKDNLLAVPDKKKGAASPKASQRGQKGIAQKAQEKKERPNTKSKDRNTEKSSDNKLSSSKALSSKKLVTPKKSEKVSSH